MIYADWMFSFSFLTKINGPDTESEVKDLEFKDDGFLGLVLKVIAAMCDGQHKHLQVHVHSTSIIITNVRDFFFLFLE